MYGIQLSHNFEIPSISIEKFKPYYFDRKIQYFKSKSLKY